MKKENKTISFTIRFFTNGLPDKVGDYKKQTPCWTCGGIELQSNKNKGLKSGGIMFNNISEILGKLIKLAAKNKIVLVDDLFKTK